MNVCEQDSRLLHRGLICITPFLQLVDNYHCMIKKICVFRYREIRTSIK